MAHRERDKTRTGRTGRKLYQTSATEDVAFPVAIVAAAMIVAGSSRGVAGNGGGTVLTIALPAKRCR